MIHYQLRCSQDHEFDGWFKDSATFEKQAKRGFVECPACGDTKVSRALMAPAVSTREAAPVPVPVEQPATQPATQPGGQVASAPAQAARKAAMAAGGPMPAHLTAMLQRMRAEVEANCDYVGPAFADEARKIHRGESEKRAIYGEATSQDAETLADEGIEVSRIPWVPRADG
ncbi:MAG TPA: DUF1178 family protein [Acetobacteraceae bacterium]|nr:DUF1178 family protein [Acetobacteraceae bacterium]